MGFDDASALLTERLRTLYGNQVPGCVFYITRNGQPVADGSFGWARMPGAPDGQLEMSPDSVVHIASVGKFFCAVAILRLIEEWNLIFDTGKKFDRNGNLRPPQHFGYWEKSLFHAVWRLDSKIDLDTKVFPLVEPYLDQDLIATYRARPTGNAYPGASVGDISLRQLLTHTSRLVKNFDVSDLGGLTRNEVFNEPGDDGPATYDLKRIVTALLRKDAVPSSLGYNNAAYSVLGAVVTAAVGTYDGWVEQRLFADARFSDLARKVIDYPRGARYYARQGTSFRGGNRHPDYSGFSASGGWYTSARQFCDWIEALMQKEPVSVMPNLDNTGLFNFATFGPIISDPDVLFDETLGLDGAYAAGRLNGATKNGGTGVGGGSTNGRFAFLRGYGDERVCAFTVVNANLGANPVLTNGLLAVREQLGRRPGPIPVPTAVQPTGLLQAVYWDDAGTLHSASQVADVEVKPVDIGGVSLSRTDLLGGGALAGGKVRNDVLMVELRGLLSVAIAGAHRFRLSSDDGSLLWLDDELIVDNDGNHAARSLESSDLQVGVGLHPIRVRWYNAKFGGALYLEWMTPSGSGYEPVPATHFTPGG